MTSRLLCLSWRKYSQGQISLQAIGPFAGRVLWNPFCSIADDANSLKNTSVALADSRKTEPAARPLNPARRIQSVFGRETILQNLMFVFCILFGLAMIANTQSAGDGGWFWYASFLRSGKHLYSDMHLALQPLFVLETASIMTLLGKGWFASKVPAVLHLVAYCLGLLLLVRRSNLSDGKRGIVLGCTFFLSISFEAYRFDDYHVLADCFQLYSLVGLLVLQKAATARTGHILAFILGVLSGLALTTRLNDGAALFVGVAVAIVCLAQAKRLLLLGLFSLAAVLSWIVVVHLTGDSLEEYAMYSVFHAASIKGGTSHILAYPLQLPINTFLWLRTHSPLNVIAYASGVAILVLYGLCLVVATRLLRWVFTPGQRYIWDRREILLLIPLGQLASGSMSSGGNSLGLFAPVGLMIVLLSICSPIRFRVEWSRTSLLVVATLLMLCAVYVKFMIPFSWHTYREPPMFEGRAWYHHPEYGPMIIDREMLSFIQPVCEQIGPSNSQSELLSLPYPFANYFCSAPPWHGYVQTFFDTTGRETILALMDELSTSPPQWILYQRQLYTLSLHETVFNKGRPLAQRYLDQLIEHKLATGSWHAVYTSNFGKRSPWDNQWILIRTR
jgi:hypothetical protein